jgi:hypothetical protein
MREEPLFGPSPELTDVLIGLDGLVPKLESDATGSAYKKRVD